MYEGLTATIVVGPAGESTRYSIPQALLCHYSKFFDRAFNGYFKESIEKYIELPEETPEEFELLLQWIYTKEIPKKPTLEGIEVIITFYIIANRLDVADPHLYADQLSRELLGDHWTWARACEKRGSLVYEILQSVYQLPKDHPGRRIFGEACVRPYLTREHLINVHLKSNIRLHFSYPILVI